MDVRALRRAQWIRECAGYLALPALYGALMAAGVLSFAPSLALLTLALVFLILLQSRSASAAGALVRHHRRPLGGAAPREQVDEADRRFLRQVAYASAGNVLGYLALLAGIDVHLRGAAVGAPPGIALWVGAAAALGVVLAGRALARRAAWSDFRECFPSLWDSMGDAKGGRATRSPAAYWEWRIMQQPDE